MLNVAMESTKGVPCNEVDTVMLNSYIKKANRHMIYKKFDECLLECQTGVKMAETSLQPEISEARCALCVVAVQAYAELSRWKEAVPFISSVYNGIQTCPAMVLQLCILLHARVGEYSTSTALAQVWLGCTENATDKDYWKVVYVYLTHVIIKQCQWESVPSFLSSCPGLSQQHHATLIDYARSARQQIAAVEAQEEEEIRIAKENEKNVDSKKKKKRKEHKEKPGAILNLHEIPIRVVKYLAQLLPKGFAKIAKKLSIFLVIAYLVITRANIGVLSYDQLAPLVIAIKQLWYSLVWRPLQMIKR